MVTDKSEEGARGWPTASARSLKSSQWHRQVALEDTSRPVAQQSQHTGNGLRDPEGQGGAGVGTGNHIVNQEPAR